MRNIKKIIVFLFIIAIGVGFQPQANANEHEEAVHFFNSYVTEANSYSSSILGMYAKNARIIRQVIKPNGQLVNVPFAMSDYRHQLVLSGHLAKIRHYKNYYSDIRATKEGDNRYKIESYRRPSTGGSKLKSTMVIQKQNGKWLIVEETMQTREQIFLKYAK